MAGVSHRAGPLKQANKSHKSGSHRSKGAAAAKGKLAKKKPLSAAKQRKLGRLERRHRDKQMRANKRVLASKQKSKVGKEVPILVSVFNVGLVADKDETLVEKLCGLAQSDQELVATRDELGALHIASSRLKQRLTFVSATPTSSLDVCRVSDWCLLLLSVHDVATLTSDPSSLQELHSLLSLSSSPVLILRHLEDLANKKHGEMRKAAEAIFSKMGVEVNAVNEPSDQQSLHLLLRHLGQNVREDRSAKLRQLRPYLVAEKVEIDEYNNELKISGYVRGVKGFDVNRLVHIPTLGSSFQLDRIEMHKSDPHPLLRQRRDVEMSDDERVILRSQPALMETLQMENEPDMFDGEQILSAEDEKAINAKIANKSKSRVVRVPKGTSEYQAAWLVNDEDDEDNDEDGDEDMEEDEDGLAPVDTIEEENEDEEEYETLTIGSTVGEEDTANYDTKLDMEEEKLALKQKKAAQMDDAMFPDEMDTPVDQLARVRFQKYRGLQSFKNSHWDPKENLPSEYARIFQFENFERTRKRVLKTLMAENEDEKTDDTTVKRGNFVTLVLKDFAVSHEEQKRALKNSSKIVVFGMLEHENRMSVVHFVVKHISKNVEDDQQVIATSKERLIFHCGYRRFACNPVFSEHTNGDKHKYLRFWHPNQNVIVMSAFAPIQFPPCPVLVFRDDKLIATGSLLSVDPDRRIVKRVLLSGYPFKVYRRSSTIRFMFFNREDILWFKPVELKTKRGLRGHIRDPLGTHGHMKCVFNRQLSQQDTVLMPLYKRVFPKWTFQTVCNDKEDEIDQDQDMMEVAETLQLSRKK